MQPQPVFKYLGTYIPNPSLLYPLLPFPSLSSLPSLPSFSLPFVPPSPILLSPSPSLPTITQPSNPTKSDAVLSTLYRGGFALFFLNHGDPLLFLLGDVFSTPGEAGADGE
nr:hypothetical protein B11B22.110 [imported] - Neurospora crassa [Neurospora crassa]